MKVRIKALVNLQKSSQEDWDGCDRFGMIIAGSEAIVPSDRAATWIAAKFAIPLDGEPLSDENEDEGFDNDEDEILVPEVSAVEGSPLDGEPDELLDLDCVDEELARRIRAAGFESVADIAECEIEDLTIVKGIGKATASRIIESARAQEF